MLKGAVGGLILVATGNGGFAARALATTDQSKLRESVSVKDFGAIGNGVADDTAAITAAAAASFTVYFPPGIYKITASITIPQGVRFYGASKYASKILLSGDIEGVVIGIHSTLDNIRIIGNNVMTTDASGRYKACLLLGTPSVSAYRFKISNVIVGGAGTSIDDAANSRCSGAAVKGGNTFLATIEEAYIFNANVGIEQSFVTGVTTNAVVFKQVECHSCGIGARFGILNAVTFDTCAFENNDKEGLILGGCRSVDIINPYFENNNALNTGVRKADLWIEGSVAAAGTTDAGGSVRLRGGYFSKGANSLYALYANNQRGISIEYPYFISYEGAINLINIGNTNTSGKVEGYYSNSAVASVIPSNFIQGNYEYTGVDKRGAQVLPLVNTLSGQTAAIGRDETAILFTPIAGQTYQVFVHATNNNTAFRWSGIVDAYASAVLQITTLDASNVTISNSAGKALLTNMHGLTSIEFNWVAIRVK